MSQRAIAQRQRIAANVRKILVRRLERGPEFEQRLLATQRDNEPVAGAARRRLVARKLERGGDAQA